MSVKEENNFDLIFKALSDSKRRRMLDLLTNLPLTTGYLCQEFPEINRCTVMQHLDVLEKAGLIRIERIGKHRWNYINLSPFTMVNDMWKKKHLI